MSNFASGCVTSSGHCSDLVEITINAGQEVMKERPDETNPALANWPAARIAA
jgi:hypothetical protein